MTDIQVKLTQDQIDWIGYFVTEAIALGSEELSVIMPPTPTTKEYVNRANEAIAPLGIKVVWDERLKDYVYEDK